MTKTDLILAIVTGFCFGAGFGIAWEVDRPPPQPDIRSILRKGADKTDDVIIQAPWNTDDIYRFRYRNGETVGERL